MRQDIKTYWIGSRPEGRSAVARPPGRPPRSVKVEAPRPTIVRVTTIRSEPFSSNLFLVEDGDDAILVDSGSGATHGMVEEQIRRAIDPARIGRIYLTHWHVDHVGGAAKLKRLTGADVLVHADEASAVEAGDGNATLAAYSGITLEPCAVTPVKEGDVVRVGDRRFEVLLVPGHSPAHTALYDPSSKTIFGGDLVFPMGSFGRVDFPGCDPAAMLKSIERVAALDVDNLYPGHMEPVEGDADKAIAWSLQNARAMLGGAIR